MRPEIRFDDLDALRSHCGGELGEPGPTVAVTQAMIDQFADLTDDHQWIHVDVERAASGPFGGPIAHGMLTVAMMPKYRPSLAFDVVGESARVNYGCESFRFLAPVPAGATLQARCRLVDVREHAHGTLLVQELMVSVVGNDRPSLVYTGLLLYRP